MYKNKKAFTLAEIMIALVIIGTVAGIVIPSFVYKIGDKDKIMKFKKGNETLVRAISTLSQGDKYYIPGDFSIKPSGELVDDSTDENKKYFCNTLADILSLKKNANCSTYTNYSYSHITEEWGGHKETLDTYCKETVQYVGAEIETKDGIIFYETSPGTPFGMQKYELYGHTWTNGEHSCGVKELFKLRTSAATCEEYNSAFLTVYKPICMDIDGIGKGEDPFGYGIRVDGKILSGARAEQWLEKEINK